MHLSRMIYKTWLARGYGSTRTVPGTERLSSGCHAFSGRGASRRLQNSIAGVQCSCSRIPGSRVYASSSPHSRTRSERSWPEQCRRALLAHDDHQEPHRTVAQVAAVVPEIHDVHETFSCTERARSVSLHFYGQRAFEDVRKERHRMHMPADLAARRELRDECTQLVLALGEAEHLSGGSRRRLENLRDLETDGRVWRRRFGCARNEQMHECHRGRADERCNFHVTTSREEMFWRRSVTDRRRVLLQETDISHV